MKKEIATKLHGRFHQMIIENKKVQNLISNQK
jgi:hypothetical protein